MKPRDRVLTLFDHKKPDVTPCFGANSTATYELMEKAGAYFPEANEKAEEMAKLALAAYRELGFDAVRVPYCQTFEAEALGCVIKHGGKENVPGIDHPPPYTLDDAVTLPDDFLDRGRIPELIEAVRILKKQVEEEVAIIGGIIGPFTIAGALLDSVPILKATFRSPEKLPPFLDVAERAGTLLGKALIEAGADLIVVEDMQASPELIAPRTYRDLELAYQKKQIDALDAPVILHICGRIDPILEYMVQTGCAGISIEPKTDVKLAREAAGEKSVLIGAVDCPTTLFMQTAQDVDRIVKEQIGQGFDVIAPGCAIPPGTPTENLLAMVKAAHNHRVA